DALAVDYYDWPVAHSLKQVLVPGLVTASLVAATTNAWFRWPMVGFLGAAWFILLGPTSSIFPLRGELVAERRLYLPAVLLCALVVVSVGALFHGRPAITRATIAIFIVALGVRTFVRNRDFVTETTLYAKEVAVRPNNLRAVNNYGLALEREGDL